MSTETPTELQQATIKLADITVSPSNPRKEFDEESINELAASIREKGVLQPVLLRPKGDKFELVCGERRYRASKIVQGAIKTRDSIPAVIRDLTDDEALELQIIENLQRQNVHPMDEAAAFAGLIKLKGYNVQEIAKRIGKQPKYIAERLRLNDLISEWQKALYQNRITLVIADAVCKFPKETQKEIWEEEGAESSGKIQINNYTFNRYQGQLNSAAFDLKDPSLNKEMGGCGNCKFNSASSNLFPDQVVAPICTNLKCFKLKTDTSFEIELKKAMQDPSIELVSTEWNNPGKKAQDLQKKGFKVSDRKTFDIEEAPDPVQSYEDYKDDMFDDDDDEVEFKEQYQKEIADYNRQLDQHNKKISSGKYIKAFVVDGNDSGKYIHIYFKKGVKGAQLTAAGLGEKIKEGVATPQELQEQIKRIQTNQVRKKELDQEKINDQFADLLKKQKGIITKSTAELKHFEKVGMVIMLCEHGGYGVGLSTLLGCDASHPYRALYKKLSALTPKQIDAQINAAVRTLLVNKMCVPQSRPDANGKAAVLADIVKGYLPKESAVIVKDQEKEATERAQRAAIKIEAFKKKIKAASGTKAKAAAGKKEGAQLGDTLKKVVTVPGGKKPYVTKKLADLIKK